MLCPYYLLFVPLDHEIGHVASAYFQVFDSSPTFQLISDQKPIGKQWEDPPSISRGSRVREDPLGSRRSEILNPSNNDYWVAVSPSKGLIGY